MNFFVAERTYLAGRNFRQGDSLSIKGREFDLVRVASFIDMYDRTYVAQLKAVPWKIGGQSYRVEFLNHSARG